MGGNAPLEVTVRCFGLWRGVLILLGAAGLLTTAAWWLALPAPRPGWAAVVAAAAALLALLAPCEAVRLRPLRLRWDGERWHVAAATGAAVPRSGRLQVAIDLGGWLLLRFVGDAPAPRRAGGAAWIALQRTGLETDWHAVRCTLYSPPSAGLPGGTPDRSPE